MDDPKNMMEFMDIFNTEADCRTALFEHRWPDGFRCPRCDGSKAWVRKNRLIYECAACGYQASLTAGTILHKTRVSLKKWFLAIYLVSQTKKTFSAAELSRQLGVDLKTAWAMRRKITHAMAKGESEPLLSGLIEMDEAFLGGHRPGVKGRGAKGKAKVAVMAKVSPKGKPARAQMQVIASTSRDELVGAAQDAIAPGSNVATDGWQAYWGLNGAGFNHEPHTLGGADASEVLPAVHLVIANFKRWALDVFHGVSPKHLQSYLDEFCYRLNRRQRLNDLFRRVLNRCVRYFGPVSYAELTANRS